MPKLGLQPPWTTFTKSGDAKVLIFARNTVLEEWAELRRWCPCSELSYYNFNNNEFNDLQLLAGY